MIYKQVVGLSEGQKITEIKDANGDHVGAITNLIMEAAKEVPCVIGDPIQKIIEIIADRPFGFKILDANNKFVCKSFSCETMKEETAP